MTTVKERFLKYIAFDTKSDETSTTFPSTSTQLNFGNLLASECNAIGLSSISIDQYGYVTATLPSNSSEYVPTIGFVAHMDTSPDTSGSNIKPNIVENYNGEDIALSNIILSPSEFPYLKNYIGDTIITTDGTTLLGSDDKAGISEILTAMEFLIQNPQLKHGTIKIAFTPDEEIGKGVDFFDINSFNADFAYTIDGGRLGELEYENFNAARATITISGKSVHPGTAKGIMINAALIGTQIAATLPPNEIPSETEKYEGFFHLTDFTGNVSRAKLTYIIRDFDYNNFNNRKKLIESIIFKVNQKYNNLVTLEIHDEYYNMFSKIEPHNYIVELAKEAMIACEIEPIIQPIRGGTDGARLSYMGLPCPNIFTGGHNFHGPYEFIPVSSMEKAVQVIIKIAELSVNLKK